MRLLEPLALAWGSLVGLWFVGRVVRRAHQRTRSHFRATLTESGLLPSGTEDALEPVRADTYVHEHPLTLRFEADGRLCFELHPDPEGRLPPATLLTEQMRLAVPSLARRCPGDRWQKKDAHLLLRTQPPSLLRRTQWPMTIGLVRHALGEALRVLDTPAEIARTLESPDFPRPLFEQLLRHATTHFPESTEIREALARLSEAESPEIRFLSARALQADGKRIMRRLARSPDLLEPMTRGALGDLLGTDPEPEATEILIQWLASGEEDTKKKALNLLGGRLAALSQIKLVTFDRRGSLSLRTLAVEVLTERYRYAQWSDTVTTLIEDDRAPSTLRKRAFELASQRGNAPEVWSSLWPLARRQSSPLRSWAIRQLSSRGLDGDIRDLVELARRDRSAVLLVIDALSFTEARCEDWLFACLEDADPFVVAKAGEHLSRAVGARALDPIRRALRRVEGSGSADAIGRLRSAASRIERRLDPLQMRGSLSLTEQSDRGLLSVTAPPGALERPQEESMEP